jgi:hypothetical protein
MMRIDLEHWPSMELQEPRHHASRLSGTRKLATYVIAMLILLTMAVWFSVISYLGDLSRYFHWLAQVLWTWFSWRSVSL